MSELTPFTPATPPAAPVAPPPMRLVEWAEEARAAHALAQSLCQTPFAGQYRGDALGATAAILKGAEVGLTPVTALGAFDLIQGTPAPKAITLRALVQSHGHDVWVEHSTDTECVAKARRKGSGVIHESRWTIARAQRLGLTGKPNWKNQPAAMLIARATSEVCRMVAADVILGIGYSAEEVEDSGPTTVVERAAPPAPAAPTTRVQRKRPEPPPVIEEPPLEESDPGPEPDDVPDDEEPITPAQQKALHATLRDAGATDREVGLELIASVIGRPIESSKHLSKAEASRVIDALKDGPRWNTKDSAR